MEQVMPQIGYTPQTNYKLFNEDCLTALLKIQAKSVDLVLADPPYGVTWAEWDSVIPFATLWNLLLRVIKPDSAIVIMSCQPFTTQLINSQPELFKYVWYWDKNGNTTGHMLATKKPLREIEELVVFYKNQPTYNPQMKKGKTNYNPSGGRPGVYGKWERVVHKKIETRDKRYPTNLIQFSTTAKRNKRHPHEKPVSLLKYMIETYTNPRETVLDFCIGSGSTGVAAAQCGRRFVGMETDKEFYKTASRRIEAAYQT